MSSNVVLEKSPIKKKLKKSRKRKCKRRYVGFIDPPKFMIKTPIDTSNMPKDKKLPDENFCKIKGLEEYLKFYDLVFLYFYHKPPSYFKIINIIRKNPAGYKLIFQIEPKEIAKQLGLTESHIKRVIKKISWEGFIKLYKHDCYMIPYFILRICSKISRRHPSITKDLPLGYTLKKKVNK